MAKGCRLWRSEKCSCLWSIAKGDCTICIVRQFSYLCNSSSGRVEIGRQARLRIWCLARMGSSPFARTTKKEVTKVASFFCEVRSSAAAAAADCSANSSSQQPPNWATRISLRNSVPERGFSCTESTRGTVEGFLRYATCFLRHSVLKIGFYGTEAIFGVRKGLLGYGRNIRCGAGGRKTTPERTTGAQQSPGRRTTTVHKTTTRPQNNHQGTTTTRAQQSPGHKRRGHNI